LTKTTCKTKQKRLKAKAAAIFNNIRYNKGLLDSQTRWNFQLCISELTLAYGQGREGEGGGEEKGLGSSLE